MGLKAKGSSGILTLTRISAIGLIFAALAISMSDLILLIGTPISKKENYVYLSLTIFNFILLLKRSPDKRSLISGSTVLNNVKQDTSVAREEIFGPVLSVLEYEDQDEAIHIANDTDFGLGAGVFTKDLKKASWTASKLESGQVYVNKWFAGNHATPFGGYKQSGYSREKGVDALKSYLQVKNVGISLD